MGSSPGRGCRRGKDREQLVLVFETSLHDRANFVGEGLQGSGPAGDGIAEAYQLTLTDNSLSATAEVRGQELTSDTQNFPA